MTLLSISIPVLKAVVLLWSDSGKGCVEPLCKNVTSFWVEFPKTGGIWSRRVEHIAFKASLFWGIDRRLIWWLVKALSGPVTLKKMNICTLAHFAFLCFSLPWFFSPLKAGDGHASASQMPQTDLFSSHLWALPHPLLVNSHWLARIRQPPYIPWYLLLKASHDSVFFKAFQSNYNSFLLIKLVPPQHSVTFFLATLLFEELLVVFPQRDIPFCLIVAGQTDIISTSVAALRQNGAGRNQGSGVEEISPPPKSLYCDPGLWFGGKTKSLITETFLVATDLEYCCCCSELLKITSFFYLNLCSCTVLAFCLVILFSEFQSAGCAVGSVRLIGW